MEIKNKTVLIIVALSLVLNIITINRIGSLSLDIQNIRNSHGHYNTMLESRINNLSMAISNIAEENKWITSLDINPNMEESEPQHINLDIEFSLREIEDGAQVQILYKSSTEEFWNEADTINMGGNSFKTSLILGNEESYNYQIVSNGKINKVSEIKTIPPRFYRPNPLEIIQKSHYHDGDGVYAIEIHFAQFKPLYDFHKVKRAEAKVYIDNELDRALEIKPYDFHEDRDLEDRNKRERHIDRYKYHLSDEFDEVLYFIAEDVTEYKTRIIVSVEFYDGTTYEGEVYPSENYMKNFYY